jgi:uncharacterized membrane protein
MKRKPIKIINTEEVFNIGLFGFTIASQMNPSYGQLGLYLLFIITFFVYLHGVLMKYKEKEHSVFIFALDFIRAFTLPVGLAFLGLAYSFKSFMLTSLGVGLLVLYLAIVWSFWSIRNEE